MYILAYITCIMYKYYINDHERLREIMANLERVHKSIEIAEA